ncbi:uncharacterized protein EI90DRAFT_3114745 [Cantharellus anzutake]|uniref:uncharacterized protein n=1 Tax=Cantharellus anzutake TaxID=1750568 RepID=UPI001905C96B|nr:uncharacterized protein EI90DRAFT_3114745 [Cantharellus anzutake]KAF8344077.1 hypothetical protein EI90DRAFT_3114745 [Cantharellus anzutake]
MSTLDNPNPVIFSAKKEAKRENVGLWLDSAIVDDDVPDAAASFAEDDEREAIDENEVFGRYSFYLLRSITDPEHPTTTLEQLGVVSADQIKVTAGHVNVQFTPTVPHCGMATLIGLSMRVRLLRSLPSRYKVDLSVKEGTHQSENAVNKQLNDKERVAAALENPALLKVVNDCLSTAGLRGAELIKEPV